MTTCTDCVPPWGYTRKRALDEREAALDEREAALDKREGLLRDERRRLTALGPWGVIYRVTRYARRIQQDATEPVEGAQRATLRAWIELLRQVEAEPEPGTAARTVLGEAPDADATVEHYIRVWCRALDLERDPETLSTLDHWIREWVGQVPSAEPDGAEAEPTLPDSERGRLTRYIARWVTVLHTLSTEAAT
jgi:hypothetical protein